MNVSSTPAARRTLAVWLVLAGLAILFFWPWFKPGIIGYGDWVYNLPSRVREYFQHWLIWDGAVGLGTSLGLNAPNNVIIYWFAAGYGFFQEVLGISVSLTTRLFWFIPYIVLSFSGAAYLGWFVTRRRLGVVILGIVYPLSTFGLLTVQGGQMTVGVAYALAPWVLGLFGQLLATAQRRYIWWLAVAVAVQTIYDIRIVYVTVLALLLYTVGLVLTDRRTWRGSWWRSRLIGLLGSIVVAGLLSAYWVIPLFLGDIDAAALPTVNRDAGWLISLSYATLTHAWATNHVWWPWSDGWQNAIQPLFLVTLILALLALGTWRRWRAVLIFVLIWLAGVWLTKGVQPPAGGAYGWLFAHLPGFSMFRDPAKFFTLVMLGVAPLVAVGSIWLTDRVRRRFRPLVVSGIILLLLAPLTPFISERHATFVTKTVPAAYERLNNWLAGQEEWGRTLWWPRSQRYLVPSQLHPVMEGQKLLELEGWDRFVAVGDPTNRLSMFTHPLTPWLLDQLGVRYVGLPWDSENEIYRHFGGRRLFARSLDRLNWLTPVSGLPAEITLYANDNPRDQVYTATTAVALDEAVIKQRTGLPTLDDHRDVLGIVTAATATADTAWPGERLRLLALEPVTNESAGQASFGRWQFHLPAGGTGQLQLDPALNNLPLTLDDRPITTSSRLTLAAGRHELVVDQSALPTASTIVEGVGLGWQPCNPAAPIGQQTEITTDALFGTVTVSSTPVHTNGCAEVILPLLPTGVYRLSATGLSPQGGGGDVALRFDLYSAAVGVRKTISTAGEVFFSVPQPLPARLQIGAQPTAERPIPKRSSVVISSVKLEKIVEATPQWVSWTPAVGGATGGESVAPPTVAPPAVTATTVTPRQYQVKVAASDYPYYLVLNQQYASGWRLTGLEPLAHVAVNGGVNGWWLPAGEARELTLTFGSYQPYYLGLLISTLTAAWVIYVLKRDQKKG